MSPLEIVLVCLMGVGVAIYLGLSIYDLIHPEKKKARKEARKAKKLAKKEKKQDDNMDEYF